MPTKKGGTPSASLPEPTTVREYAEDRAHLALDPALPTVRLDTLAGKELTGFLDAYATLRSGLCAYVGSACEANLRTAVLTLVTAAIRAQASTLDYIANAKSNS